MSLFNPKSKTRAAARGLFPSSPEVAAPARHSREATAPVAGVAIGGRLKYRATPFYLKIDGLEGPRQSRFV